jgi:hypothetical protein
MRKRKKKKSVTGVPGDVCLLFIFIYFFVLFCFQEVDKIAVV